MCIACDWSRFRNLLKFDGAPSSSGAPSRRRVLQAGAVLAAAGIVPASLPTPAEARSAGMKADIVFRNGAVYTVSGGREWARAVAVRRKRIVYVGDDAGVQAFVGPGTRVIDLAGRMLLPGFVEAHIHPMVGSVVTRGVDLQFDTRDETIEALKAYRASVASRNCLCPLRQAPVGNCET
ncbi:amidohydrolase family protein [Bradyrhizobium sp. WD16]|uniref:amidohydrolase family protein n=1 Tax=Bradyrhizobium sp. WD16 TaxID=1521768 RepID=UPI0020A2BC6A|nr:amidohydrolase family protein [Bradyrhizobium sp. WD16]UTD27913.1 hypothetical protein DB459_14305 [Bradyrhizobium sp. WD16]